MKTRTIYYKAGRRIADESQQLLLAHISQAVGHYPVDQGAGEAMFREGRISRQMTGGEAAQVRASIAQVLEGEDVYRCAPAAQSGGYKRSDGG
ncbi:MAG: hypothetical protein ACE5JS_00600 [Nitrospinota bacterium]